MSTAARKSGRGRRQTQQEQLLISHRRLRPNTGKIEVPCKRRQSHQSRSPYRNTARFVAGRIHSHDELKIPGSARQTQARHGMDQRQFTTAWQQICGKRESNCLPRKNPVRRAEIIGCSCANSDLEAWFPGGWFVLRLLALMRELSGKTLVRALR